MAAVMINEIGALPWLRLVNNIHAADEMMTECLCWHPGWPRENR